MKEAPPGQRRSRELGLQPGAREVADRRRPDGQVRVPLIDLRSTGFEVCPVTLSARQHPVA